MWLGAARVMGDGRMIGVAAGTGVVVVAWGKRCKYGRVIEMAKLIGMAEGKGSGRVGWGSRALVFIYLCLPVFGSQ